MTITISDATLLAQFAAAHGVVELADPSGRVVTKLYTESDGALPPRLNSPLSDEEFEELRKQPDDGRSLAEIISDLEEKYGR